MIVTIVFYPFILSYQKFVVPLQRGEDRDPALRAIRILSHNPEE